MAVVNSAAYLNYGNGSSTGYYAVTQWSATTSKVAGNLVRQLATPAVGSERVFACYLITVTGVTGASEPAWVTTIGAKTTTDGTTNWIEVTAQPAMNGDITNGKIWVASTTWTQGQCIIDSNNNVQVCTVGGAGGTGSAPTWAAYTTTGATTADASATWTNLGTAASFRIAGYAAPSPRLANLLVAGWLPSFLNTTVGAALYGRAVIFQSSNSQETQAVAMTVAGGTAAVPVSVFCVLDNASGASAIPPTTSATGATVTTTGANAMTLGGAFLDIDGASFFCGTGATNVALTIGASNGWIKIRNGTINKLGTIGTTSAMMIGANAISSVELVNVGMVFGSTSDGCSIQGYLKWTNNPTASNTGVSATNTPSILFNSANTRAPLLECYGVDLSNVTGSLITLSAGGYGHMWLYNCRINGSVNIAGGTIASMSTFDIRMVACSSTTQEDAFTLLNYQSANSNIQTSTATYRNNGSSDGVSNFSRSITTSANCSAAAPFVCDPIVIWLSSIGTSITPVISFTCNSQLYNNDIWCEVEYLGNSGYPLSKIASDGLATSLSTPAFQPTDSVSTWTIGKTFIQTLGPSFTPQLAGPVLLRVKIARPSINVFIDQKPTGLGFNSNRQYQHQGMMMNEGQSVFVIEED